MSVEGQTADEAQTTNMEKKVTVIGYAGNPDQSVREFASEFDPEGRDFTEREESEYRRCYVSHWDSEEGERVEEYISEDAYEVLLNSSAFDPENDENVRLKREVSHSVNYARDPEEAVGSVVEEVFEEMMESEVGDALDDDGYYLNEYGPYVGDEVMNKLATFGEKDVTEQKVLVHQSERDEADSKFETDAKRPALQFTVTLEGDEETVEELSEKVVGYYMGRVARLNGVTKVRVSDCVEKVEREGDCFDL